MRLICALSLLIVSIAAARVDARDWTAALDRGEVLIHSHAVKGFEEPEVVMKAVINVAPRRVFDLLADCAGYVRSMPRIKSARVDRRGEMGDVCTVTVDMPFPYSDVTSTCRSTYTIKKDLLVRSWRLVKGDYKLNRGRWELRPFRGDPGRTLVTYRAIAVPKAWVPGWIRTYAARRSLPETIKRFRELLGAG